MDDREPRGVAAVEPPATPIRDWLAAAIGRGWRAGCPVCRTGQPCAGHAADAVLDACRREDLFIMDRAAADAVIEAAVAARLGGRRG